VPRALGLARAYLPFAQLDLHALQPDGGAACLTRRGGGAYWSGAHILSTVREELRLQGFPDSFRFPEGLSESACRGLSGNSMSVNVLRALFKQIFREAKLASSQ
jgi:site-specific DNA-cytosine methylase